jgi:hypothetical protein
MLIIVSVGLARHESHAPRRMKGKTANRIAKRSGGRTPWIIPGTGSGTVGGGCQQHVTPTMLKELTCTKASQPPGQYFEHIQPEIQEDTYECCWHSCWRLLSAPIPAEGNDHPMIRANVRNQDVTYRERISSAPSSRFAHTISRGLASIHLSYIALGYIKVS